MKKSLVILSLFLANVCSIAQDSSTKKFEFNGYIKDLQSIEFTNNFKNADYTNLLHNRVNLKWKPSAKITASAEIRNRFYWGSDAEKIILSHQSLRNENEGMDLGVNWYRRNNVIAHTNVERLYIEYRKPKWNARIGRQRLNWGTANIWNPDDIFNSYNFLDFDYEERPGCDAVKVQYMTGEMSNIETAIAIGNGRNKTIAAAKYFFNKRGYDFQILSGIYQDHFTIGLGWAGNINDVGFKSESQFYLKNDQEKNVFNSTVEFDYIFKNGWYINAALLYENNGLNSPITDWSEVNFKISPTHLMPAKWNILAGSSKEFTPLFSGTFTVVYSPGINMLIFFPSLKYNLFPDVNVDLFWQSFFSEVNDEFKGVGHAGFIRIKWSF